MEAWKKVKQEFPGCRGENRVVFHGINLDWRLKGGEKEGKKTLALIFFFFLACDYMPCQILGTDVGWWCVRDDKVLSSSIWKINPSVSLIWCLFVFISIFLHHQPLNSLSASSSQKQTTSNLSRSHKFLPLKFSVSEPSAVPSSSPLLSIISQQHLTSSTQ